MSSKDQCGVTIIHHDLIHKVEKDMISDQQALRLAEFFKMFADGTRTKILYALALQEMCVCDLSYLLGTSQSAVSHQLKVLRQSRIVKNRREGKVIYYSLDDDHIVKVFQQGLEHINDEEVRC